MSKPELVFVVGPNAAGKSSFIRTRINELDGCEIIMTDVYKSRSKTVFKAALKQQRDIILETVFNDESFKDLVDQAKDLGYRTSLIVLFLDTVQHSLERVAFRSIEQNGLMISGNNIKLNFNESFKNVAKYFFYFDQSDFIYTGITGMNKQIMSFSKSKLVTYHQNELQYPQKFAQFSFHQQRLNDEGFEVIQANKDYQSEQLPTELKQRRRLKI
jgi:predicted ABC-type ATPase